MTMLSIAKSQVRRMLVYLARSTWMAASGLLVAVLALLEPVIRLVCVLAMLLGIVTAVVFEISGVRPAFPFLTMLAASLCFGLVLVAYYALVGLLLD